MGYKHTQWRWKNIVLSLVLLMLPMVMCAMEQQEEVKINGMNLIWASRYGEKEVVESLINGGANINAINDYGETALMFASSNDHKEVVDNLIKAEADINAADYYGNTALMGASCSSNEEIVESLIKAGAHINAADNFGYTALMWVSRNGYKEAVDSLIEGGANPYIKNNYEQNSLDLAGDDEELKKHIIKKRSKYVIKKYKEYLMDRKNRIDDLAGLLQKEYDWYKPYWDENNKHDEHNLQEVKQFYLFPKDIAGVIAKFAHGISDDEWKQMCLITCAIEQQEEIRIDGFNLMEAFRHRYRNIVNFFNRHR